MTAADPLPQPATESTTDACDHERTTPPDHRHRTPQQSIEHRADDSPGSVPLRDTPVVLDTDIGADADDAFALAVAALSVPQLSLVLTSDELPSGQRARFARHLLNQLGRADLPVVAGPTLEPAGRQFCVADLIPPAIPAPPTDAVAAVGAIVSQTRQPIRWIGCGPASNLAHIVHARPEWATRLRVTQMGGAIRYRDPDRAEHNFRRDPEAIRTALAVVPEPQLVVSDTTFTPKVLLTAESALYRRLAHPGAPGWARLLAEHLDRWITTSGHSGSMQHDPLALSVALGLPFVTLASAQISVDRRGRMRHDPRGVSVWHSQSADHPGFRRWLADTITHRLPADRGTHAT